MTDTVTEGERRDKRLDARVTSEEKQLFERAAALTGRSTTGFVVSSVLEAARRVIREHESMQLGARDREAFVAALRGEPEPNAALQRAARDYEETVERKY